MTGIVSSVVYIANKILWNSFEIKNTHIYLSLEIRLFELEEGNFIHFNTFLSLNFYLLSNRKGRMVGIGKENDQYVRS